MKKLLVCLLATQLSYAMQQNTSNKLVTLPEAGIVKREIGRSIFEDFFTETSIVSQLAGQEKSYDETLETLKTCASVYFIKKDHPSGRNYFYTQVENVAQRLVSWQEHPKTPQHTCKLHAQLATHQDLHPSSYAKL